MRTFYFYFSKLFKLKVCSKRILLWTLGISSYKATPPNNPTPSLPNSVLHCIRHLATSPELNCVMEPHVEMLSLLSWIFTQPYPNIYPLSHLFFSPDFTTEYAAWIWLLCGEILWKQHRTSCLFVLWRQNEGDIKGSLTCWEQPYLWGALLYFTVTDDQS